MKYTIPLLSCGVCLVSLAAAPAWAAGADAERPAASAPGASQGQDHSLPGAPEDRAKALDRLFAELAKAPDAAAGDVIKHKLVEVWLNAAGPTVQLLLSRDQLATDAHDAPLRRQLLTAAARLAPDSPVPWNLLAEVDLGDQRFADAIADTSRALTAEPRDAQALQTLAFLLKDSGRNDLALKAFRRLQTIDPTSANIQSQIDELARKVEGQKI
jgi:tetratricopeptide (TPR) repeat protein